MAWRALFVASFFLMLIAPALQLATQAVRETPIDELRRLAKPPATFSDPHQVLKEANAWFNDHFGLRSTLIRLKTQVDYSVFGTSQRVYVGSDGWLFYRHLIDKEKPEVEDYLSVHEADVLAGLRTFSAALRRHGIQPLVVVPHLADRFYPDKLPSAASRGPTSPRIDSLLSQIERIDTLLFVPTEAILRDVARQRPVFHRTDFHWNDPAAFSVAKEIVDMASRQAGRPSPWRHDLEIGSKRMEGGVSKFMPLLKPVGENALTVKVTWTEPPGTRASREGIFSNVILMPRSPENPGFGGLVIIGTSFSRAFIRSGIHMYFDSLHRTVWDRYPKISTLAQNIPPGTSHLIIEFIETKQSALEAFADAQDIAKAVEALDRLAR